jgi:zinc transport system substrate-binding protein
MMMVHRKKFFIVSLLILILGIHPTCQKSSTERIKVATTTSILGSIVEAIGEGKIDIVVIVPGGMCPGHFDITPGDVANLTDSKVLINHGWEQWITDLLDAVEKKPVLHTIDINGNLMVPEVHTRAAENVAALLCSLDYSQREHYLRNVASYLSLIDSLAKKIQTEIEMVVPVKVVCSELQVEFVKWLGFDVVATYNRTEDFTPKMLSEIIQKAKEENVTLVVDNLQSGPDAGVGIAEEIGAQHVTVTNFPLNGSYPDALMENFKTIMHVLQ